MINITKMYNTDFADTLAYSDRWDGPAVEEANIFIQFMSSNDLIFVVLSVSLVIWFILAFYLVKVDKKLTELEDKISNPTEKETEQ